MDSFFFNPDLQLKNNIQNALYESLRFLELDEDLNILHCNEQCIKLFNSSQSFEQLNLQDVLAPSHKEFIDFILEGTQNQNSSMFHLPLVIDGHIRWFKMNFIKIKNQNTYHLLVNVVEITDIVQKNSHIHDITAQLELKLTEIKELNLKIENRRQKLANLSNTLIEITKSKSIQWGNLEAALQFICQTVAKHISISRVGIWQYDSETNSIKNVASNFGSKDKIILFANNYPQYFKTIVNEKVLNAFDARIDERTCEFKDNYLEPLNIFSMLDVPYFVNGKFAGVICCEQTENKRLFDEEEVLFLKGISDIITIAIKSAQRKNAEDIIKQQSATIEKANKVLKENQQYILQMNEELELKVSIRTLELEKQNEQLKEYAFINAHLLRGPLCRIQGLLNVIDSEPNDINAIKTYVAYLRKSSNELDDVIAKITNLLAAEISITRNEIRHAI
jgi:hypothetical protein